MHTEYVSILCEIDKVSLIISVYNLNHIIEANPNTEKIVPDVIGLVAQINKQIVSSSASLFKVRDMCNIK